MPRRSKIWHNTIQQWNERKAPNLTDKRWGDRSGFDLPDASETSFDKERTNRPSLSGLYKGWMIFLVLCVAVGAGILVHALYELQVTQYEEYAKLASQQHWRRIKDEPERGDILDINGDTLAGTTYVYTIGITPKDFLSLDETADATLIRQTVASILGLEETVVADAMAQTESVYVQLAKNVTKEQADTLKLFLSEHKVGGTAIDSVAKRYYTYGPVASQVLGYATATDGLLVGQLGIEAQYNSILTGKEGYSYVEVDNYTRSALPFSAPTTINAQDGYNVVLNLDLNVQNIVETACEDVFELYDVIEGVTAIVMDPYTGRVHAMASYPDFDPNAPTAQPDWYDTTLWDAMQEEDQIKLLISEAWRNRAISDTYEPGSTFKALTTAIALEEGLTYEDEFFLDDPIDSGDYTISCWSQKEGGNHGEETLREAFMNSCNPIFVQLAQRIGIDKYYQYIHNFGFYLPTGIDLPVEGVGIFHKEPTLIDLQTLSFGESSTVTPLQLANAYCAIVNGGTLMTPQIANCLTDDEGNIVKEFEPQVIRTILSEKTSERIKDLMEEVVTEGTGSAGKVEGFSVAGKTSTSTIETGDYAGLHVLSFGCYAPSDDPEIVVLVVVNMPADKEVGSSCATRTAASIISQTLDYMGVERHYSDQDYTDLTTLYTVPDVNGMTYKEARKVLYLDLGEFVAAPGAPDMTDETIVNLQYPAAKELLYQGAEVVLYPSLEAPRELVVLPDFTGKNITECIREARDSGVNILFEGNLQGIVSSQNPMFSPYLPTVAPTPAIPGDPTSTSVDPQSTDLTPTPTDTEAETDPSTDPAAATETSAPETPAETNADGSEVITEETPQSVSRVEKGSVIHLVLT